MAKERASASVVRKELGNLRKIWGWTPSDLISLLRGGGSSAKGSDYEREVCKRLSLWWTDDKRDDVFWRSSGSGARAKVRGRAGAQTAGQHGDVAATDPIGAPLIDALTIEIKRGYSEYTFQDVIDRLEKGGIQEWERWFGQAIESHDQSGSVSWMLITRRDRRSPLVWFPHYLFTEFRRLGAFSGRPSAPFMRAVVGVRTVRQTIDLVAMPLDTFLEEVCAQHILALE